MKRHREEVDACPATLESHGTAKERLFFRRKNGPLFRDPFFNAWSGKRNSHLASDILKPKGFVLFLKQEWIYFQGV
jgi:hypothetical protein